MSEPRWLDEVQQQAWQGLLCFINRGLPEIERTLKQDDLLVVHYSILVTLSAAADRTLRLSELADVANLSQSRLTHRMRTLVERGYVVIAPDPDDGRAKNATLTAAGFGWLETVAPRHVEDLQRLLFDHLDAEQTRAVADGFGKVADSLCEQAHSKNSVGPQ
jgi:DNA-binding MarR family transcriptional regulator